MSVGPGKEKEHQSPEEETNTVYQSENLILLTGTSNPQLARDVANILQLRIDEPIDYFEDTEARPTISCNLRRKHAVIIQPTGRSVNRSANDHIMELLLLIDDARRASADEITAIIPYFGYSRQDRKERPRVPISSSIVARLIEFTGADRIVTIDIHSEQQEGFTLIPWDNLYASYSLLPAIKKESLPNLVVASPDKGGVARATAFANRLQTQDIAIFYKQRDVKINGHSETLYMIGDVRDKTALLVDDIIASFGTLDDAAKFAKNNGAKRVLAAATHGLFTGKALERLNESAIEKVFVTDTVELRKEVINHPKIAITSIAPLLAEVVIRIENGLPLSELIL